MTDTKIQLSLVAPHVMVTKPFDKRLRKVEIGLREPALSLYRQHIHPLIAQEAGFRTLVGSAPRGQLERQLQEFIDLHLDRDL